MKVEGIEGSILYHYTTADAFVNMLESASLWLTHYQDFSDNQEVINGFKIIGDKLRLMSDRGSDFPFLKFFIENQNFYPKNYYIFSLCPTDNDYLWRTYADKSKGVSIGFDAEYFISLSKLPLGNRPADLAPISYNLKGYIEEVEMAFLRIKFPSLSPVNLRYVVDSRNTGAIPNYTAFKGTFTNYASKGMLLKRGRYFREREWRLVHCSDYGYQKLEYIKCQEKRRAVIKFHDRLPIKTVRFGRKMKESDCNRITNLLRKLQYLDL